MLLLLQFMSEGVPAAIVKLIMVSLLLDMDRLDSIMEMIAFMEENA